MPSAQDVVEIAESIRNKPIAVIDERCVAVRNRNSTCRSCAEVCIADAISVSGNDVHLNLDACMACGACTAVCPTEALVPLEPPDETMAQQTVSSIEARGTNQVVIACARIASKLIADPRSFVEVPCLCRVDESFLLSLASHGTDVLLVDGVCKSCKYRDTNDVTDFVIGQTKDLIAKWGSDARIDRASEFPEDCSMHPEDVRNLRSRERRGFFGSTANKAKEAAYAAAMQELHLSDDDGKQKTLRERLQAAHGHLPQFPMVRHDNALNALDQMGQAVDDEPIHTTMWGHVVLDAKACNGCGMCVMFCPTGALKKVEGESPHDPYTMEFTMSACTDCGLCQDACFKKAIRVEEEIKPSQLMSFDPETLRAVSPSQTFGSKRLI